jgi:hypothetical protein
MAYGNCICIALGMPLSFNKAAGHSHYFTNSYCNISERFISRSCSIFNDMCVLCMIKPGLI